MVTENTEPPGEGEVQAVTPEATQPTERLFTQDEVNRISGQRAREVRAQYGDYKELQERAAKADELEQDKLTEQEKLEARAIAAEQAAASAASQVSAALIASEVKVKAVQMGVVDPDAAYLLLDKANVHYTEETGVVGVDDALTQLLDDKPYLRGANRAPNLNPQTGEPAPTFSLTPDQREAARLMGISEEQYSAGL